MKTYTDKRLIKYLRKEIRKAKSERRDIVKYYVTGFDYINGVIAGLETMIDILKEDNIEEN